MALQAQGRAMTARQKLDLVVALIRGQRSPAEISAESGIDVETLNHWGNQVIAGGQAALEQCIQEPVTEFEECAIRRTGRWWNVT